MKFKIDENLPIEIAQLLCEAGHDAIMVIEQNLSGVKDYTIANVCQNERRALVTLDTHFSNIRTYPPTEFSGLIVLRITRQDKPHVLQVMDRVLGLFDTEILEGQLWIVDESKIRIRS
jgi:predicted nuclease of predicted toxin-antitoxin system